MLTIGKVLALMFAGAVVLPLILNGLLGFLRWLEIGRAGENDDNSDRMC